MRTAKPGTESPTAKIARLRLVAGYRIVAKFYRHGKDAAAHGPVGEWHFPPAGVPAYTFDEAVEVLRIFCARRNLSGGRIPPAIEPVAVEVVEFPPDRAPRRPARFTLHEIYSPADPPADSYHPFDEDD